MDVDILIFGGGASGLWLLDECTRNGLCCALVSNGPIGGVQTLGSQGILHCGIKYALDGTVGSAVSRLAGMPALWRSRIRGQDFPDLSAVRIRSRRCYLWQTERTGASPFAEFTQSAWGNSELLELFGDDRPPILKRHCTRIWRSGEWVIDPRSLIETLAGPHRTRILFQSPDVDPDFRYSSDGDVTNVRLTTPDQSQQLELTCRQLILAAGAGNCRLRQLLGLPSHVMQRRPLQMVVARGNLPELHGHAISAGRPLLSVTTVELPGNETGWQLGGQLAEEAVNVSPSEAIRRAELLLRRQFPTLPIDQLDWMTYHVDRAEGQTPDGLRPEGPALLKDGNVLTVWPTKLAFLPLVAEQVLNHLPSNSGDRSGLFLLPHHWPTPPLDTPPWWNATWRTSDGDEIRQRPSAA